MKIVVVGAGPAGLMAADVLARKGHEVAVYDQRRSPARKFVLAGRGGLNITHTEPLETFLDRYGPERPHLESSIRAFTPDDLRTWCAELGHESFSGSSGRVFPAEFRAVPLLRSWLRRLDQLGVQFHLGHRWQGWAGSQQFRFAGNFPVVVPFDAAVLALGGASWPRVSSDGSWRNDLAEHSIEVAPLRAANCGACVEWSTVMVERFAGEPIKNTAVLVEDPGTGESLAVRGDPIVSETGLEGGPIYAHSRSLRRQLDTGSAALAIDLFPDIGFDDLEERLSSRRKGESAARWLRRCGFSPVGAALLREVTGNDLPKDAAQIAELAKSVPIHVTGLSGLDRAISSAGGVAWTEVDESFQLRKAPTVYAVGEMLDWEAPTGGYLLQACFSTAVHAAKAIGVDFDS